MTLPGALATPAPLPLWRHPHSNRTAYSFQQKNISCKTTVTFFISVLVTKNFREYRRCNKKFRTCINTFPFFNIIKNEKFLGLNWYITKKIIYRSLLSLIHEGYQPFPYVQIPLSRTGGGVFPEHRSFLCHRLPGGLRTLHQHQRSVPGI
jgi:hypothetical protein